MSTPEIKSILKGDYVFREGETGGFAYILQTGEVEIVKATAEGTKVLSEVTDKGALFGEMAIIDGSPRSASARASSDVSVTEIDRTAFLKHISARPDLALNIMSRLAGYVRSQTFAAASSIGATATAQPVGAADNGDQDTDADRMAEEVPDTDAIYDARADKGILYTAYALVSFMVLGILFMSITSVDTTVSSRGKLTTTVPQVIVQATNNSVIKELLIGRGERVAKGDVVGRLDEAYVKSNLNIASEKLAAVTRRIARLEAEQALLVPETTLTDAEALADLAPDHADILAKRLREYRSRELSFAARLDKIAQEITSTRDEVGVLSEQLDVKREVEAARKALYDRETGSLLSYLTAKDARLSALRALSGAQNAYRQLQTDQATAQAERQAFVAGWHVDLAQERASEHEKHAELTEEVNKLERQFSDLSIRAPVDGLVLDLPKASVGSIVTEGEALITLVPLNVPLVLEVDIDPKDVSDVTIGAPVSVKLDALPFQQYGDLDGTLTYLSADTYPESLAGEKGAFYRGRVDLENASLESLPPGFRLTPGMLANGDLKVGKRRLISYFTHPILKSMNTAFREPD